jgi:hypothetical protein
MIYTHTVRSVTLKEAKARWIFSDVLASAARDAPRPVPRFHQDRGTGLESRFILKNKSTFTLNNHIIVSILKVG